MLPVLATVLVVLLTNSILCLPLISVPAGYHDATVLVVPLMLQVVSMKLLPAAVFPTAESCDARLCGGL